MARRSFIFCDICNPLALRAIEMRRSTVGRDSRDGRRLADGRAWFDGGDGEAKQAGWISTDDGQHICPACFERLRSMRDVLQERLFVGVSLTEVLRDEID
jgi:hypothetical protein